VLRAGAVEGRLSTDTFADRIERTLTARSRGELDAVVADLRPPGATRRAVMRAVAWFSTLDRDLKAAWQRPHVPVLALPEAEGSLTLGRSRECDCVLADPNVSRKHAELKRNSTGDWHIGDLGSTNGVKVNGRQVDSARLTPGDQVQLGTTYFTFDIEA
jgi:FHA domain/Domain of unknown function (DUF1707)